jgi:hypothetical protein
MKNEFTPYDRSLKLKELGFDEPCFGYYYTLNGKDWKFADNHEYYEIDDQLVIGSKFTLLAPTFSQAFRWFREKYGLAGLIEIGTQEYSFIVFDEKTDSRKVTSSMNGTYEEAELACLDKLIEIVESKQNK